MRPRNPGTSVTGSGKSRVTEKHQRYRGCNPVTCVTRALRVRASARASVCEREHGSQRSISPVCIYGVTRVTQVTYRENKAFRSNPIVTSRAPSGVLGYGNAGNGALGAPDRAIATRFGCVAASQSLTSPFDDSAPRWAGARGRGPRVRAMVGVPGATDAAASARMARGRTTCPGNARAAFPSAAHPSRVAGRLPGAPERVSSPNTPHPRGTDARN